MDDLQVQNPYPRQVKLWEFGKIQNGDVWNVLVLLHPLSEPVGNYFVLDTREAIDTDDRTMLDLQKSSKKTITLICDNRNIYRTNSNLLLKNFY